MPRRAKFVATGDVSRVSPIASTIQEMQRQLEDKLQQEKTLKLEAKQLKDAIAEARKGQQARRASVLGFMLLEDSSDAGRALMAACLARLQHPEHRVLFGLEPRSDGLLGASAPGATTEDTASGRSVPVTPDGDAMGRSGGRDAGDAAASDPSDQKDNFEITSAADEAYGSPSGEDRIEGPDEGGPGRTRDDGLDVSAVSSEDAFATGVGQTDRAKTSVDGTAEGASVAGSRSPRETTDDAPTSPGLDIDPFAPSTPPSFTPHAFISTREMANRIKALGFKLQKRDGGNWTVTATTAAEMAALAPLGLKLYDHGPA